MSSTIIQKEDVSIHNDISLFIPIKDAAFSCTITSSFCLYASNTASPSRSKRLGPAPPNLRRGHRHLVAAQSSKPLTPAAYSGGFRNRHCHCGHAAPVCAKARTGAIGWRPHSTGSPSGPASPLPHASL